MVQGPQKTPPSSGTAGSSEPALDKEAKIAAYAAVGAAAAAFLYWLVFDVVRGYSLGEPGNWAEFGDYFGGLVNPLVGIVTVVLVVRTLQTTRTEAADTRRQLELQTGHMGRERDASDRAQLLAEMRIRLDGVLAEWNRVLTMAVPYLPIATNDGTGLQQSHLWPTVGAALNDSEYAFRAVEIINSPLRNRAKLEWLKFFHPAVELATELAIYCQEYEAIADNKIVADFYRRRVTRAVHTLHSMDLLPDPVQHVLTPTPAAVAVPAVENERSEASLG